MAEQREQIRASITHKDCRHCNKNKEVSAFCKKSAAKDGYQSFCKDCTNRIKIAKRKEKK